MLRRRLIQPFAAAGHRGRRLSVLAVVALVGCSSPEAGVIVLSESAVPTASPSSIRVESEDGSEVSPRVLRRFGRLDVASHEATNLPLVQLGRMLYYEPRLSRTGLVACNTCHPLDRYGATNDKVSTGIVGRLGKRNAPSTYHAAGHFSQFWDGRAPTIVDQAKGPIVNAAEMGMNPREVVAALESIPGYRTAFTKAFPDQSQPISFERVAVAIGAFEKHLVTPSRWDRYLGGDKAALTAQEKEGAKLFANLGCLVCHTGPYIGGSMFQKVGARLPWPTQEDRGRRGVTGDAADDMVFKVPSLRNVGETAPYFHDGSAATLEQAIGMMAMHQLGIEIEPYEIRAIASWLRSLTGEIPHAYVARPSLPDGASE